MKHIRLSGDMNNNKMGRMNGEFRDREKIVRSIKTKDSVLINGYQMYHNYLTSYGVKMARLLRKPAELRLKVIING
jgi:hypothetical protein